ncbi:MAG: cell division protein ZipA [Pseudomonadota bacterium]
MQKELQLALLVIGGIFIIGILVHGFWITRRQRRRNAHLRFEKKRDIEPKFYQNKNEDTRDFSHSPIVGDTDEFDDTDSFVERLKDDETASGNRLAPGGLDKDTSFDGSNTLDNAGAIKALAREPNDEKLAPPVPKGNGNYQKKMHASPLGGVQTDAKSAGKESKDKKGVETSQADTNPIPTDLTKAGRTDEKGPLYADVVTQPKPEFLKDKEAESHIPAEPPSFLLKQTSKEGDDNKNGKTKDSGASKSADAVSSSDLQDNQTGEGAEILVLNPVESEKSSSLANQAKRLVRKKSKSLAEKLRREPVASKSSDTEDDQMRMDFGESKKVDKSPDDKKPAASETASPEQDVIILNIQTSQDNPIQGAILLQMLLTLGFKFGDHDIFHRHVNTNGKGPVLFSLANLFKPGVFDIDNIEKFTTQGLSLFMMLPIEGEAQQVFNMMHNAARKIADEFGGKILDANKVPISKQSLQQYAERIRDFERRQKTRY